MLDLNPRASIDSIPYLLYTIEQEEKETIARQQDATSRRDRCYYDLAADKAGTSKKII